VVAYPALQPQWVDPSRSRVPALRLTDRSRTGAPGPIALLNQCRARGRNRFRPGDQISVRDGREESETIGALPYNAATRPAATAAGQVGTAPTCRAASSGGADTPAGRFGREATASPR
jgi:hypothetical protein